MQENQTNSRVRLINLAPWPVYFPRINTLGDVSIQQNGSYMIDREELLAQCYNNNRLIMGTDGRGAHATVIIMDEAVKAEFDIPENQEVLTDEVLDKLFAYKRQADFEKAITAKIVRDYEAHRVISYISRKKVNDFNKVRFVEGLTGLRAEA